MSTNFYLHRDPKNCGECGKPGQEAEVHIGKRSGGWVFVWQGFDATFDESTWREFLTAELADGGRILDEYGVSYSLTDFMAEVEGCRGQRRQSAMYEGFAAVGPDDVSYGNWF